MPLYINRVARGLLSFFESKTSGQPPQTLADEIRATVDLGELLRWGAAENLSSQLNNVTSAEGFYALTDSNFGIVPQDQTWVLLRASIIGRAVMAGADILAGAIAFRTNGNPGSSGIQAQDHTLQINQSFNVGFLPCFYMAAPPQILHPGDQLGFLNIGSTLAAAYALDFNMRVLRLRV